MRPEIKQPKIHSGHMECAVAALLNFRVYTIVPNVSWGAGFRHECDMLAIDSERRFTEVEIKISLSDLKADFKKPHGHKSNKISRLVYAIPEFILEKGLPLILLKICFFLKFHYFSKGIYCMGVCIFIGLGVVPVTG